MKLSRQGFAISNGREEPPTDQISREAWVSITALPDDVSLRTSEHFGSLVEEAWSLWREWISVVSALQGMDPASSESPIAHSAMDAIDFFQASVYNALVGFYRLAFTSLRSVIENITISMTLELSGELQVFSEWQAGRRELHFGGAADQATAHPSLRALEHQLRAKVGDNLFRQKAGNDAGGLARRLFRRISGFAHAAPGLTDADLWRSNGPVFAPATFEAWAEMFLCVYALGLAEIQLARPRLRELGHGSLFTSEELLLHAVGLLPESADSRSLFMTLAAFL